MKELKTLSEYLGTRRALGHLRHSDAWTLKHLGTYTLGCSGTQGTLALGHLRNVILQTHIDKTFVI